MKKALLLCLVLIVCGAQRSLAAAPSTWNSRGVGGGGGLYWPTTSPYNPNELWLSCDMGQIYHTTTMGASWATVPFGQLTGGTQSHVQYTNNPSVLYCLSANLSGVPGQPRKSVDGGVTWQKLSGWKFGQAFWLFADITNANRVLVGTYSDLYVSTDGGSTFNDRFSFGGNNLGGNFLGGAYFNGSTIYVMSCAGLLVSNDGGQTFAVAAVGGIPATEGAFTFCGATQNGVTRLYCATVDVRRLHIWVNPPFAAIAYGGCKNLYTIDWGQPTWSVVDSGIHLGDQVAMVGCARNDISNAYVCGQIANGSQPIVYKSSNGGNFWNPVLLPQNNSNIFTGWCGWGGDMGNNWWWGSAPLGFDVSPYDSTHLLYVDMGGLVHHSTDGGANWHQAYTDSAVQHAERMNTPPKQPYHSAGLEPTVGFWMLWQDSLNVLAGMADITAIRSQDGGTTWSFNYSGLNVLSNYSTEVFHMVEQPATRVLYAAQSNGSGNLYQSQILTDSCVDPVDGMVRYSADGGQTWNTLHDFGHTVAWLALDPHRASRMYATVASSTVGGIYVTNDLQDGALSQWAKVSNPPRTQGHPFNVFVLNDGTLVCTYSARRDSTGAFTQSSGVFTSADGGVTWTDRSATNMQYWTRNLVIDPWDPSQSTWYVGVFNTWGAIGSWMGGLYKTTNRGNSWSLVYGGDSVESCAFSPSDPNEMYITTENSGLLYSDNRNAFPPTITALASYPFNHPQRVFYNPYKAGEVWVASFGNGLSVGNSL